MKHKNIIHDLIEKYDSRFALCNFIVTRSKGLLMGDEPLVEVTPKQREKVIEIALREIDEGVLDPNKPLEEQIVVKKPSEDIKQESESPKED